MPCDAEKKSLEFQSTTLPNLIQPLTLYKGYYLELVSKYELSFYPSQKYLEPLRALRFQLAANNIAMHAPGIDA